MTRWSSTWRAAAAILSLWMLSAHVYTEFRRVRLILVREPVGAQGPVALPLAGAAEIPDNELVLVYRARNTSSAPVEISVRVGDRVVRRSSLEPGSFARFDAAWPRPGLVPPAYRAELEGTGPWTLEYAEMANLHGFTRGVIDFLILPERQSFGRPPAWLLLIGAAGLLLVLGRAAPPFRGKSTRTAHLVVSAAVLLLFVAAAASPLVSAFRLVLAPHTFVAGLLVLFAPEVIRLLDVSRRVVPRLVRAALGSMGVAVAVLRRSTASVPAVVWLRLVLSVARYWRTSSSSCGTQAPTQEVPIRPAI
jgi:hypothetical protein